MKAAVLAGTSSYFVAKTNANFPHNPVRAGLPTIQGVVLLFDASNGRVLSALDSGEVTVRRTAAATALAARHLARPESRTMLLCGCGRQGRAHVRALVEVLPLEVVFVHDADPGTAERLASDLAEPLGLDIRPVRTIAEHARAADVCVTCTPSRIPILGAEDVRPGAFVAGVGADYPDKSELAPALLAASRVIVDVAAQCIVMGDVHHAIAAGVMTKESIHAELGDVISGRKTGRSAPEDIIVFDSTGMALQDVAASAVVYERARSAGSGREFSLDGS